MTNDRKWDIFNSKLTDLIPLVFMLLFWAHDVPRNMCSKVFFPVYVLYSKTEFFLCEQEQYILHTPFLCFLNVFYKHCWLTSWKEVGRNVGVEFDPDLENGRILNENAMKWDSGVSDIRHWKQHAQTDTRRKADRLPRGSAARLIHQRVGYTKRPGNYTVENVVLTIYLKKTWSTKDLVLYVLGPKWN